MQTKSKMSRITMRLQIISMLSLITCLLGCFATSLMADQPEFQTEPEKIVQLTIQAINDNTPALLDEYLADDFTMPGVDSSEARTILHQMMRPIGGVSDSRKISETKDDTGLTLVYEFDYTGHFGTRPVTFLFDNEGKLKQLELVPIMMNHDTPVNNQSSNTPSHRTPNVVTQRTNQDIIQIPLIIYGFPVAEAILNGETRYFVIDNGAPSLALNNKYLFDTPHNLGHRSTGMIVEQIASFDFYGLVLTDAYVPTTDMSQFEENKEFDIYGIIGYELFSNFDLLFDYENELLTLLNPEITENYLTENFPNSPKLTLSMEMSNHIPLIKGKIGENELTFALDSGAATNVLDVSLKDTLADFFTFTEVVKYGDILGISEAEMGAIDNLSLAGKTFNELETIFIDISDLLRGEGTQVDGFLGYELLKNQKVLLRYANEQVILID